VDASERLAALLAGDLDADERIALEAELARDAELRADLEALERADAHLERLPSPEPPAGFEQRLDDRVTATLAEVLGAPEEQLRTGSTGQGVGNEFTARRQRRASRRMQAMVGVAAAAVVLVGSGVLLTSFGGDDDAETADDTGMFTTTDSADDADEEAADADEVVAGGPIVVAEDRTLDADDLDDLLAGGELEQVAAQGYDAGLGQQVAGRFQAELGVREPAVEARPDDLDAADEDRALQEAPAEESAEDGSVALPELFTRDGASLSPAEAADLARCLEEVVGADPDAIPAYAELATFEDADAIVLGLVTPDPETGAFTRNEVWVLDRATCQLLRFAQG
jgi:hypothetical protein